MKEQKVGYTSMLSKALLCHSLFAGKEIQNGKLRPAKISSTKATKGVHYL